MAATSTTSRFHPIFGLAHPTKSKVGFGCMRKNGFFYDLKIWKAEPSN